MDIREKQDTAENQCKSGSTLRSSWKIEMRYSDFSPCLEPKLAGDSCTHRRQN